MKVDSVLDRLARNRTILANERTFLAYTRTSIMLAVSSITLIKFLGEELLFVIIGILLLLIAVACVVFGLLRYRTMNSRIAQTKISELIAEGDSDDRAL